MELVKSPNKWSCLPTSFAMACDRDLDSLLLELGHNGSEIIWPTLPEPLCRRGFHIQELIYVVYHLGHCVMPFEARPCSTNQGHGSLYEIPFNQDPQQRLMAIMQGVYGVITGTTLNGQPHAVAWDGVKIFDPAGIKYGLDNFILDTFWLVRY